MTPERSRALALGTLLVAPPVIYALATWLVPPAAAPDPWATPSVPVEVPASADPSDDPIRHGERRFYDAINARDATALGALWSPTPDALAEHAGWSPVRGREAILEEYGREFATGTWTRMEPGDLRVRVAGPRAEVALLERVETRLDAGVRRTQHIAMQVWMLTSDGWRLLSHRTLQSVVDAGPAQAP